MINKKDYLPVKKRKELGELLSIILLIKNPELTFNQVKRVFGFMSNRFHYKDGESFFKRIKMISEMIQKNFKK